MTETAPDTFETFEMPVDSTWSDAVALFQDSAREWLTPADAPQLMALRSIATELDNGKFQAALISQFTLIHRSLREKGDPARRGGATSANQPDPLDLLKDLWNAD